MAALCVGAPALSENAFVGKITDISKRDHLISIEFPDDPQIVEGDYLLIPLEKGGYKCRVEAVKVLGETVIAHTRHCGDEKKIQVGMEAEKDPYGDDRTTFPSKNNLPDSVGPVQYDNILAAPEDEAPVEAGQKSRNEWWYTYWALGPAWISYPQESFDVVNPLRSTPGVSHLSFALDALGVYFPRRNFRTMVGGVASLAVDRFSDDSGSVQINQYLLSGSAMHFFGTNIGHGIFVRGDLGLAWQIHSASGTGLGRGLAAVDYLGVGFLLGAGYAYPITQGTRVMGTLAYAIRIFPNGSLGTASAAVGLLF